MSESHDPSRNSRVPANTLLRLSDVILRTGLSRATIYARAAKGEFPAPLKIGEKSSGWVEAEINRWVADRIAERDQDHENASE